MLQKRNELNVDVINSPQIFKIVQMQKIVFENARLEKNYDIMRSALQNLLDNIISKAKKEDKQNIINKILKALKWYDGLAFNKKYIKKLPTGEKILILPNNIEMKVDYAMSYAYQNINQLIDDLNIV